MGSFPRDFERRLKECSGNGASLSVGVLTGTWKGDFLTGDPEGYVKKALEMGISLLRGPALKLGLIC